MDLRIIATTLLWFCLELSQPGLPPSGDGLCTSLPLARQAHGVVVDLDEKPLARARVLLVPDDPAASPYEAETDLAGRFRIPDPAPGRHSLSAVAPGFRELTVPGIEIPAARGPWPLGTLVLEPGMPLRGRVSDPEDHGIAGARVAIEEPRGAFPREPHQTAADGGFVLNGLPATGLIRLRVGHPGFQSAELEVPTDAAERVRVVLSPGVDLKGEVVDDEGRPVPRALIEVERKDEPAAWAVSGDDGSFRMTGLAPGRARLRASADSAGIADPVEVILSAGVTPTVRLVMRVGSRITGWLRADAGEIVAGADIAVEPYRPGPWPAPLVSRSVTSDAEGRFAVAGLAAGRYRVTVRHPDYAPAVEEVRLAEAETARIDVVLAERDREALTVHGQVTAARSTVAVARVVLCADGEAVAESSSSAAGLFTLEAPTAGSYFLEVTHPQFAMHREPLRFDGEKPLAEILVELFAGGTISGELTGVAVNELSRLSLVVRPAAGGGPMVRGKVSYDSYVVEHLTPGNWLVSASLGNRTVSAEVSLPIDGDDVRADLHFTAGHRLHGRVLRDGAPVVQATVQAFCRPPGFHAVATAGAYGTFVLDDVPAGSCDLLATSGRIRIEEHLEIDGDREVDLATRTFRVAGQVLSSDLLEAIPGATIELSEAGATAEGRLAVRSDARGRFNLAGIEQGMWRIRVNHEGFGATERLFQVGEDAAVVAGDWQFLLPPTEPVDVYVLGADGVAPEQISLEVLDARGDIVLSAEVYQPALDGRVTLRALPPGSWWLRVAGRGQVRQAEIHVPGPSPRIELGGPSEEP